LEPTPNLVACGDGRAAHSGCRCRGTPLADGQRRAWLPSAGGGPPGGAEGPFPGGRRVSWPARRSPFSNGRCAATSPGCSPRVSWWTPSSASRRSTARPITRTARRCWQRTAPRRSVPAAWTPPCVASVPRCGTSPIPAWRRRSRRFGATRGPPRRRATATSSGHPSCAPSASSVSCATPRPRNSPDASRPSTCSRPSRRARRRTGPWSGSRASGSACARGSRPPRRRCSTPGWSASSTPRCWWTAVSTRSPGTRTPTTCSPAATWRTSWLRATEVHGGRTWNG
jgi:hypothetical protein